MPKQLKLLPDCVYGNPTQFVGVNPQCKKPGFICETGLNNKTCCSMFHLNCDKMEWSVISKTI